MRAWAFTRRGRPLDVLQLTTLPTPDGSSLGPDELLIKVSHASLNLFSSILTWIVPTLFRTLPSIPENDFSGVVAAVGPPAPKSPNSPQPSSHSTFSVGDAVFGSLTAGHHIKLGRGTLAEYVVATSAELAPKPERTSFAEAAGMPTVGVTAYYMVSRSQAKTGDRVLVNGGSGGAGLSILQALREVIGPEGTIVATCSAKNEQLVREYGADEVVDYTAHASLEGFLAETYGEKPFDAILDTVGTQQGLYNASPRYLKAGKPFLVIGSTMGEGLSVTNVLRNVWVQLQGNAWPVVLGGTNRPWVFVDSSAAGPEFLKLLAGAMKEGKHKGKIDSEWGMEDAKKVSHAKLQLLGKSLRANTMTGDRADVESARAGEGHCQDPGSVMPDSACRKLERHTNGYDCVGRSREFDLLC